MPAGVGLGRNSCKLVALIPITFFMEDQSIFKSVGVKQLAKVLVRNLLVLLEMNSVLNHEGRRSCIINARSHLRLIESNWRCICSWVGCIPADCKLPLCYLLNLQVQTTSALSFNYFQSISFSNQALLEIFPQFFIFFLLLFLFYIYYLNHFPSIELSQIKLQMVGLLKIAVWACGKNYFHIYSCQLILFKSYLISSLFFSFSPRFAIFASFALISYLDLAKIISSLNQHSQKQIMWGWIQFFNSLRDRLQLNRKHQFCFTRKLLSSSNTIEHQFKRISNSIFILVELKICSREYFYAYFLQPLQIKHSQAIFISMEDYERRKHYRVHLKNISEIKNCRTPLNYTAYSSRLFNFSLKTTFRKRQLKSLQRCNSQPKLICDSKKNEQRKTCDYFRQKQNERLGIRLCNASGSINMNKYEREYEEHKKLMKMHRRVKQFKRVILYKIYDITFKGVSPNLKQQFTIYDMSADRVSDEQLLKGNIYELRNSIIRGFRDEKLILKIVGRNLGVATIINGETMVPIMHRKQIVGTLIIEVS